MHACVYLMHPPLHDQRALFQRAGSAAHACLARSAPSRPPYLRAAARESTHVRLEACPSTRGRRRHRARMREADAGLQAPPPAALCARRRALCTRGRLCSMPAQTRPARMSRALGGRIKKPAPRARRDVRIQPRATPCRQLPECTAHGGGWCRAAPAPGVRECSCRCTATPQPIPAPRETTGPAPRREVAQSHRPSSDRCGKYPQQQHARTRARAAAPAPLTDSGVCRAPQMRKFLGHRVLEPASSICGPATRLRLWVPFRSGR